VAEPGEQHEGGPFDLPEARRPLGGEHDVRELVDRRPQVLGDPSRCRRRLARGDSVTLTKMTALTENDSKDGKTIV
jgi:hypothetical protein